MFDKKEIDAYRNIKVSEALSQKVITKRNAKTKSFYRPVAAAACALLLIGYVLLTPQSTLIFVGGDSLQNGETVVWHAGAKASSLGYFDPCIEFTLQVRSQAVVTVSCGYVVLSDGSAARTLTLDKGDHTLQWMPTADSGTVTICTKADTKTLTLAQNETGDYTLSCYKQHN